MCFAIAGSRLSGRSIQSALAHMRYRYQPAVHMHMLDAKQHAPTTTRMILAMDQDKARSGLYYT